MKVLFIHHSVGRHLIIDGRLKERLRHGAHTADVQLWDIDYAKFGTRGPDGNPADIGLQIPADNTDPEGLLALLTDPQYKMVLSKIVSFDLVIHKACYPASHLSTDSALAQRMELYRQVFDACGALPTSFLLLTPPPLTRLRTTRVAARNAVQFATWLAGSDRPPNVDVLDLHRVLRAESGPHAGTLAPEYRLRLPWDSHPNQNGRDAGAAALNAAIERICLARTEPTENAP